MNEKNNNQEKDSQHETLFKEKNESRDKFIRNRSGENRAAIKKTYLQSELLETKRVTKVTKGGRRFSFATLTLLKDESQKKVSFSYRGSKDMVGSLRKSFQEGRKKLINYWKNIPRTIPHEILINYKATKIFLKPAPPGSGIKAGSVLNKLFKYLEIKDISAKIIGSRNKLNVIRAAFLALDKLTGKKYNY